MMFNDHLRSIRRRCANIHYQLHDEYVLMDIDIKQFELNNINGIGICIMVAIDMHWYIRDCDEYGNDDDTSNEHDL